MLLQFIKARSVPASWDLNRVGWVQKGMVNVTLTLGIELRIPDSTLPLLPGHLNYRFIPYLINCLSHGHECHEPFEALSVAVQSSVYCLWATLLSCCKTGSSQTAKLILTNKYFKSV